MDIHPDEGLPEEQWYGFLCHHNLVSLLSRYWDRCTKPNGVGRIKMGRNSDELMTNSWDCYQSIEGGIEFDHHEEPSKIEKVKSEVELVSRKDLYSSQIDLEAVIAEGYKTFEPDTFDNWATLVNAHIYMRMFRRVLLGYYEPATRRTK